MAFRFDKAFLEIVRKDLNSNKVPMLVGEPGIGKSSWVKDLARLLRTKCIHMQCNQLSEKADVNGVRTVQDPATGRWKQIFFPHMDIEDAIAYAEQHPNETPILFMDEINRTPSDVTSALLGIPTDRRVGDRHLPDNLKVVCAGNDKGNVTMLDTASISRFVIYHVTPDVMTYRAVNPGLNKYIDKVLAAHPETILCMKSDATVQALQGQTTSQQNTSQGKTDIDQVMEYMEGNQGSMDQFTTPRTLTALSEWLNQYTDAELQSMLANTFVSDGEETSTLQECIVAHIGHTVFTVYLLSEISTALMNQSMANGQGVATITEPPAWAAIRQAATMTDMMAVVGTMDNRTKSACLTWALYDNVTNTNAINVLAGSMNAVEADDLTTIIKLAANGELNSMSIQALQATNTPVSQSMQMLSAITNR